MTQEAFEKRVATFRTLLRAGFFGAVVIAIGPLCFFILCDLFHRPLDHDLELNIILGGVIAFFPLLAILQYFGNEYFRCCAHTVGNRFRADTIPWLLPEHVPTVESRFLTNSSVAQHSQEWRPADRQCMIPVC